MEYYQSAYPWLLKCLQAVFLVEINAGERTICQVCDKRNLEQKERGNLCWLGSQPHLQEFENFLYFGIQ